MKIQLMREFLRLAELQNFSKTAEELYITQPALSRHIAVLEDEVGAPLILRSKTNFELTPAGKIAREDFSNILHQYQATLNKISRLSHAQKGELHLGILYYDMDGYVRQIRDCFHEHFPKVTLHLHSFQPHGLEDALLARQIDAALFYGVASSKDKRICKHPFLKMPFSLVLSSNHPLAQRKGPAHAKDLEGELFLQPAPLQICRTADIVQQMLTENGVTLAGHVPVANFDEVPLIIKETNALYTTPLVKPSMYSGELCNTLLEPDTCSIDVSAVWLADGPSPLVDVLLSAIKIAYS